MSSATRSLETVVEGASGMLRASEKAVVNAALGRRLGVLKVDANPLRQMATVV